MRIFVAPAMLLVVVLSAPMAEPSGGRRGDQVAVVTTARPSAATEIETILEKQGLAAARARMREIESHPDRYLVTERDLNALGYRYLARKAFQEALAIFEFSVRRFPASGNVYDSLAEAAAAAGDASRFEATLKAWTRAFPGDASVEARMTALRALMERGTEERRRAYAPGQPTGVQGAYLGQTPPGTTPALFAPGIVSLAFSNEAWASVSPDGKEIYFAAAGRNPGATMAPPTGRARFGGADTLMVSRLGPGGWTFPEPISASAGYAAREPHASASGTLFWEWLRALPPGEADPQNLGTGIWSAERTAAGWSQPRFVGLGMAISSSRDGEVFVTDVSELLSGNAYLARARMKDGRFASLDRLQAGPERLRSEKVRNLAHPVIAPDGSYLVFDLGGPPARVCFRNEDGTWGDPIDLSAHGLTPRASVSSVSPDGEYLFLNMNGDIYWVSAQVIEALRPAKGRQAR